MATKNYVYRAYPIDGPVLEQMTAGHRYRNQLAELELARREQIEKVLCRLCPAYVETREALARTERDTEKAIAELLAARKRHPTSPAEHNESLKQLREPLKQARAVYRAEKKAAYARDDVQREIKGTREAHRAAVKAARKATEAFWGTYLIAEDAAKDFCKGAPPRFKRWRGEGTIAVQLQRRLSVEDLFLGQDSRLAVSSWSGNKHDVLVRMRVGSEGRAPVWAAFRVRLHRALPAGGRIKWFRVFRRVVGVQVRWQAMFTVDSQLDSRVPRDPHGVCAVHLGWRRMADGGLRVASWIGSDGSAGELRLGDNMLSTLEHTDDLQSACDQRFESAKGHLKRWCRAAEKRGLPLPAWLTGLLSVVHTWRSHDRLARLSEEWSASGFEGDAKIVRYLAWWRGRKERHLKNWRAHRTARLNGQRDDLYRCLVAHLGRDYRYVALLDVDWKKLGERRAKEDAEQDVPACVRRACRFASPGKLERFLQEKFGADTIMLDSQHMTARCAYCGHLETWDHRRIVHTCEKCHRAWDQDENAARNQLASGQVEVQKRRAARGANGATSSVETDGRKFSARQQRFRDARKRRSVAKAGKEL